MMNTGSGEGSSELPTSVLGTKDYWDSAYKLELSNFFDHGDVGEVWFGEDSAVRIVRWMSSCDSIQRDDSIIDLGCGNGMLLIELARKGFTNLTGVDYSEAAVQLAKAIAKSEKVEINFETFDVLATTQCPLKSNLFKIVLDKGTYDAISLNPENTTEKRNLYIDAVRRLMHPEGLFILTSCNWTQTELEIHFKKYFSISHVLPTPKFQFGGKTGNTVTSIVFRKSKE